MKLWRIKWKSCWKSNLKEKRKNFQNQGKREKNSYTRTQSQNNQRKKIQQKINVKNISTVDCRPFYESFPIILLRSEFPKNKKKNTHPHTHTHVLTHIIKYPHTHTQHRVSFLFDFPVKSLMRHKDENLKKKSCDKRYK